MVFAEISFAKQKHYNNRLEAALNKID